jgi:hypothetical protein
MNLRVLRGRLSIWRKEDEKQNRSFDNRSFIAGGELDARLRAIAAARRGLRF